MLAKMLAKRLAKAIDGILDKRIIRFPQKPSRGRLVWEDRLTALKPFAKSSPTRAEDCILEKFENFPKVAGEPVRYLFIQGTLGFMSASVVEETLLKAPRTTTVTSWFRAVEYTLFLGFNSRLILSLLQRTPIPGAPLGLVSLTYR